MKTLLSHLCFWRHLGDEAKFAVVAFLPLFIGLVLPIVYPLAISLTYANPSVVERTAIILDLDKDFWQYISMEYFKQQIKAGEVGSSAMPHKVNPIDYENSEGNLGIANAILEHLAVKLPVSRLQRDLTDSTVLRNVGVPLGHMLIAIASTLKGLRKLLLNEQAIAADLDNAWAVVAEGIQTILRREGYPKPYETLKALTRVNTGMNAETISSFIDTLNVSDAVKAELHALAPGNYTGM